MTVLTTDNRSTAEVSVAHHRFSDGHRYSRPPVAYDMVPVDGWKAVQYALWSTTDTVLMATDCRVSVHGQARSTTYGMRTPASNPISGNGGPAPSDKTLARVASWSATLRPRRLSRSRGPSPSTPPSTPPPSSVHTLPSAPS